MESMDQSPETQADREAAMRTAEQLIVRIISDLQRINPGEGTSLLQCEEMALTRQLTRLANGAWVPEYRVGPLGEAGHHEEVRDLTDAVRRFIDRVAHGS